jgi:hypothetical protein
MTPLHFATYNSQLETVNKLLHPSRIKSTEVGHLAMDGFEEVVPRLSAAELANSQGHDGNVVFLVNAGNPLTVETSMGLRKRPFRETFQR